MIKRVKKAEMNMWWVIMGAVAVMVMVIILIIIFSGGVEKGQKGLFSCISKGGTCKSLNECVEGGGNPDETFQCSPDEKTGESRLCCFKGALA